MTVHIDEAGRDIVPFRINDLSGQLLNSRPHRNDFSVLNRNVCRKSFFTATINNHTIFYQKIQHQNRLHVKKVSMRNGTGF